MDMNYNGRADSTDLVCLSNDGFFAGVLCDRVQPLETVGTVEIKGKQYAFQLLDPKTYTVSLSPADGTAVADVRLNDQLEDLQFGEKNLYGILDTSDYIVLTHWTEYSPSSTENLPALNDLNETIPVIGLHTGNPDLPYINERYSIGFINVEASELLRNKLNLNGYPNYFVVDKSKSIVLQTRDIEEVLKFISSQ
jgi:hypothetical protein